MARNPRVWPPATETVSAYLAAVRPERVRWAVPTAHESASYEPTPLNQPLPLSNQIPLDTRTTEPFIVVRRSGGSGGQALDEAVIDLEVWAGDVNANPRTVERVAASVCETMLENA